MTYFSIPPRQTYDMQKALREMEKRTTKVEDKYAGATLQDTKLLDRRGVETPVLLHTGGRDST